MSESLAVVAGYRQNQHRLNALQCVCRPACNILLSCKSCKVLFICRHAHSVLVLLGKYTTLSLKLTTSSVVQFIIISDFGSEPLAQTVVDVYPTFDMFFTASSGNLTCYTFECGEPR